MSERSVSRSSSRLARAARRAGAAASAFKPSFRFNPTESRIRGLEGAERVKFLDRIEQEGPFWVVQLLFPLKGGRSTAAARQIARENSESKRRGNEEEEEEDEDGDDDDDDDDDDDGAEDENLYAATVTGVKERWRYSRMSGLLTDEEWWARFEQVLIAVSLHKPTSRTAAATQSVLGALFVRLKAAVAEGVRSEQVAMFYKALQAPDLSLDAFVRQLPESTTLLETVLTKHALEGEDDAVPFVLPSAEDEKDGGSGGGAGAAFRPKESASARAERLAGLPRSSFTAKLLAKVMTDEDQMPGTRASAAEALPRMRSFGEPFLLPLAQLALGGVISSGKMTSVTESSLLDVSKNDSQISREEEQRARTFAAAASAVAAVSHTPIRVRVAAMKSSVAMWAYTRTLESNLAGIDHRGRTLLMQVAQGGFSELVPILLKAGADAKAADRKGMTASMHAAGRGDAKALNALLDAEIMSVTQLGRTRDREGHSVLHHAAMARSSDAVVALLERNRAERGGGLDVNAANVRGQTALMLAADRGLHDSCAAILADPVCDVERLDAQRRTAVFYAAQSGNGPTINALVQAGAELRRRDVDGMTVLAVVCAGGKPEAVRTLLPAVARAELSTFQGHADYLSPKAPQQLQVARPQSSGIAEEDELDEPDDADDQKASQPQQEQKQGGGAAGKGPANALMLAARAGNAEVVRLLIDAGATPTIVDDVGRDAAGYAIEGGHYELADYLRGCKEEHEKRREEEAEIERRRVKYDFARKKGDDGVLVSWDEITRRMHEARAIKDHAPVREAAKELADGENGADFVRFSEIVRYAWA